MKPITKYEANDGTLCDTPEQAEKIDSLLALVEAAMRPLGKPRDDMNKGWIQHDPETVIACRDRILDLCCQTGLNKNFTAFNKRGPSIHPLSIIGRVLGDTGGPLDDAWRRFCNIDPQGREHEQPYFAYTAGPSIDHKCLEDRRVA